MRLVGVALLVIFLVGIVGCSEGNLSEEEKATEEEFDSLLDDEIRVELEESQDDAVAGQAWAGKKFSRSSFRLKMANKQIKKLKARVNDLENNIDDE